MHYNRSLLCGLLLLQASPDCLDLLQQLMQFDPDRRLTAAAALQHPYFSNSPAPTSPAQLPKPQVSRCGTSWWGPLYCQPHISH